MLYPAFDKFIKIYLNSLWLDKIVAKLLILTTYLRLVEQMCSKYFILKHGRVAELADAPDLGSGGVTRGGSSPLSPTSLIRNTKKKLVRKNRDNSKLQSLNPKLEGF